MLAQPRTLQKNLPAIARPKLKAAVPDLPEVAAAGPPSGNILGMAQIAADIDWHIAERQRVPPLIVSRFEPGLKQAQAVQTRSLDAPAAGGANGSPPDGSAVYQCRAGQGRQIPGGATSPPLEPPERQKARAEAEGGNRRPRRNRRPKTRRRSGRGATARRRLLGLWRAPSCPARARSFGGVAVARPHDGGFGSHMVAQDR